MYVQSDWWKTYIAEDFQINSVIIIIEIWKEIEMNKIVKKLKRIVLITKR